MDENLLARNADAANVDLSRTRLIIMGVLNVLAAGALGFVLESVITNKGLDADNILVIVLATTLFLSLFLLQLLFIKSMKLQAVLVLLETIALSAFFLQYWSWLVMLAILLLCLFLINALRKGRAEIDNQMKVNFFRIQKVLLPPAITALSLFISILYVDVNGIGTSFASRGTIRTILKPAEPVIQTLISKDFSLDMTVSKFAEAMAVQQFGSAFTSLSPAAKAQAVAEMTNQLRQQAATYGVIFKNSDAVSDVFYAFFFRQFNSIPEQYRSLIPYLVFLITFFTIKGLGGLLRWIIVLPAYVLYQFLLSVGFARIGLESRSREIILVG